MKYLKIYTDFAQDMQTLEDAERGRLFTAMLTYAETGEAPELHGNERHVWPTAKKNIDRTTTEYEDRCRKNRENIQKRWDTNVYERIQSNTKAYETYQDKEKEKDKDKDKESGAPQKGGKTKTKFTKPTFEEVRDYCRSRGNSVDAQRFVDYYEANGWHVGRSSMKDWRAAVRTWERGNGYGGSKGDPEQNANLYGERI